MVISREFSFFACGQPPSFRLQDKIQGTNCTMIFLFIISFVLPHAYTAPASSAGKKVSSFSHEQWDALLKKYVSPDGNVDYKGMKADEPRLKSYLDQLAKNVPDASWSTNQEMAYWINAYNAFTIALILQHYPVKSIRDINNSKPWDEPFITLGEKKYSLNNIEHDVLRKKFRDPRIHAAINCASKSCPRMLNAAFTAETLEAQLTAMMKSFVNDASRNHLSPDKIEVSEIFNWYKGDFTGNGTLIDFLNTYSSVRIAANAQISYLNYDWSLNEQL